MAELGKTWEEYRTQLADDYIGMDGKPACCLSIANNICAALSDEEQSPHLARVQSDGTFLETVFASELYPRPYPERTWWYHYVCEADGVVYDPMLEEPISLKDYPMAAFYVGELAIVKYQLWLPESVE